jgi:hypothetical protein
MSYWLRRTLEQAERMYNSLPEWKKRAIETDFRARTAMDNLHHSEEGA